MRDRVAIDQRWQRKRDRLVARVVQIHRADRSVEVKSLDGQLHTSVDFADLRRYWRQLGSG